jgi:energy-coupling factor transporter ATP-binding protein EcfA2
MIFISYRKDDTRTEVNVLSMLLKERYGDRQVFVDFSDIPAGAVWPKHLESQLMSCRILLAMVGPQWGKLRFESGENEGRLRLDDEQDWVRREICTAIGRGENEVRVIVVQVDGAKLPQTKWRCELDQLPLMHHAEIRHGKDTARDFEDLCKSIEHWVPELTDEAVWQHKSAVSRRPASLDERAATALENYLAAERLQHAVIQLPLIAPEGHSFTAPLNQLRIDLPLIISYWRTELKEKLVFGSSQEVLAIYNKFRLSHANAYEQESEAQTSIANRRDFSIAKDLGPGSRLVIVGDPGCGKSTLLQWIANHYARAQQADSISPDGPDHEESTLPKQDWKPILILCRDFSGYKLPLRMEDLLRIQLKVRQFTDAAIELLLPCFEQLLKKGEVILMIDGLDEIPDPQDRIAFCALLNRIALQYPGNPIVITSRVVGFQVVKESLSVHFDHLVVAPLDRTSKRGFLENWSSFTKLDTAATEQLVKQVCDSRELAKLTDNVFLLAMVAQIQILDLVFPGRRVDVYRRAVQLMIQRQRIFSGQPLIDNEVIPHLEYLAYSIRKAGLQRFSENEALEAFRELRNIESREQVLQSRSPEILLNACIESLGILNIAGSEIDSRGFERRVLQFFHQSFQEYFAGQAIKHGYGASLSSSIVSRLRELLDKIEIHDQEVNLWGEFKIFEPVMADYWQEAVRLTIADLSAKDADEAILMLLPDSNTKPKESRPRAVFALLCLADEPKVSAQTAQAVFDAVLDNLGENDGFNNKLNTWMDVAIAAVGKSAFGNALRERFVQAFKESSGEKRNQIGCSFVLSSGINREELALANPESIVTFAQKGLSSGRQSGIILTALELMKCFFSANGRMGALTKAQQEIIINALVAVLPTNDAVQNAAIWALLWLTGAKETDYNTETNKQIVLLPPEAAGKIEESLRHSTLEAFTLGYGCLVLTRKSGLYLVPQQLDWIYELAVIADGGKARRALPRVARVGENDATIHWMRRLLNLNIPIKNASRIAQALGALGYFGAEMVKPLKYLFENKNRKSTSNERDEALIYLGMIGTPEVIDIIVEAADTPPYEKDDYAYSRGLFGLLLIDNVDAITRQMYKASPHADLNAYAFGLAGSADPRGRDVLLHLKKHQNARIQQAAVLALQKKWDV